VASLWLQARSSPYQLIMEFLVQFGYISTAVIVLFISWHLFRSAAGTMSLYRLHIVSWVFYVQLVTASLVGALSGVLGVKHYLLDKVSTQAITFGFWAVCYVLIATPIAMLVLQRYVWGENIQWKVEGFFSSSFGVHTRRAFFWFALWLIAFGSTVYVYLILRRIPIVSFFSSGSSYDLALFRIDAGRNFTGNQYIRNIFSVFFAPFLSYVAYGYYRLYHHSSYRIWFWCSVLVAVAALTYDGEKAPVIFYIFSLFFARTFINGGTSRRSLLQIGGIGFVLIVLSYVLFAGSSVNSDTFTGIFRRIFQSQYAGLPLTLDTFPSRVPFLGIRILPNSLLQFVGTEQVRSSRVILEIWAPSSVVAGTGGVINTLFVAEAWAAFGWIGLMLSPLWVGFVLQLLHNSFMSLPKTPLTVALLSYFMTALPITGGITGFFWNPIWILLLLLVLLESMLGTIVRGQFVSRRLHVRPSHTEILINR